MQRVEKMIEIDAPLERVFDLFSDFESFPRWMRNIREVRYTGRRMTRWKADAPLGTSVEWEAETTRFEPDHRIAWRSVRGDVDTEGEVIFEETRRGTTMMRVMLGYDPPAGRLGALVARLFGTDPEEQLSEDLERFAEVAEGRRRQERGRRGPAAQDRPRERREARGRDDRAGFSGPADERRDYVRMQVEHRRRAAYDEETGERHRDERGGYNPRFHEREARTRHAMTPRERELERARRRHDDEYSRTAFRRGIDRLLDDPPSRDWRRWERERSDD